MEDSVNNLLPILWRNAIKLTILIELPIIYKRIRGTYERDKYKKHNVKR